MKLYEKLLDKLFARAIKHQVSALQTRMMLIEKENKDLKAENKRLRDFVQAHSEAHDKNIALVIARARGAFERIGHKW